MTPEEKNDEWQSVWLGSVALGVIVFTLFVVLSVTTSPWFLIGLIPTGYLRHKAVIHDPMEY